MHTDRAPAGAPLEKLLSTDVRGFQLLTEAPGHVLVRDGPAVLVHEDGVAVLGRFRRRSFQALRAVATPGSAPSVLFSSSVMTPRSRSTSRQRSRERLPGPHALAIRTPYKTR